MVDVWLVCQIFRTICGGTLCATEFLWTLPRSPQLQLVRWFSPLPRRTADGHSSFSFVVETPPTQDTNNTQDVCLLTRILPSRPFILLLPHTMTRRLRLLSLLALVSATSAFAPSRPVSTTSSALGSTTTSTKATSDYEPLVEDPLDAYQQTAEQRTVMYRDDFTGSGETAEDGKTLTMAYKARLMESGVQFDYSDGYVFKLGAGKVLPGWEKGIGVRFF